MKRRVLLKALRERCLRGAYRWGARSFLHSELEWVDALPKVVLQQGRVLALVAATKVLASYIREKYSSSEVKVINVDSLPIRLTQTPARCRVRPRARIKVGIGRRLNPTGDAEQRTEGVERVESPVEAEREFIEVGL